MDKALKILKAIGGVVLDTFIMVTAILGMLVVYYYGIHIIAYIVG